MKTDKKRMIKPASDDPVKEAIGHPDGPGLEEMLSGQEEKRLTGNTRKGKKPEDPHIPII
ncbi:MAG: hypothetical protein JST19_13245 [Bacteroidetes bacterium]|nr:hypothetical protein [Bacteroidota bacterium]